MVDPTWDSQLKGALSISEWDGVGGTRCAVPVERPCTQDEVNQIFRKCSDPKEVSDYFQSQGQFSRAVNEYLAEVRTRDNN